MLSDLYRSGTSWRCRPLLESPFSRELEEFSTWLKKAHYTHRILRRRHVLRLDCVLRKMRGAALGATYSVSQLQRAFGRFQTPASRRLRYRATQYAYRRFLQSQRRLKDEAVDCQFAELQQRYERFLLEVRGLTEGTILSHSTAVADFLRRALRPRQRLQSLAPIDIERFIELRSREVTRQTLQHTVGALRAFLHWCHGLGEIPTGLDDIDTPRTYRGELPPRALEWSAVQSLLRSIDRHGKSGERDYAVLHLMAHYGLRPSEVVSLTVHSIDWTSNTLRVEQRKTQQDIILPLAPTTIKVLRRYLRSRDKRPDAHKHEMLFLRVRSPIGPLTIHAVSGIFSQRMMKSCQDPSQYSPYSLRHAFAMKLLTRGVGVKAIGDVLGHRDLESTCVYLRLDKESLRGVAIEVPTATNVRAGVHHE